MTDEETADDRNVVWVVGVDGSTTARHAALWAVRHGRTRASTLRMVTAWSIPSAPALPPIGPMRKYWDVESFERDAREALVRLSVELRASHAATPSIETELLQGPSSSVLIQAGLDGELLIVGARGRGGFGRLVLGSTSTQCATHSHVPTVVVPEGAPIGTLDRIVVAVDGSEMSLGALRWALDFAAPDTLIECVNVWEVSPAAAMLDSSADSREEARERFEGLIDDVRRSRVTPLDESITVTCRLEEGDPRGVLADAASAGDLFVMGARGHGTVSSALLGSVSTWLLHHVKRAMVVVPGAPGAD